MLTLLAALLSIVALALGYRSLKRKRLIENIPTSQCAGVCIGLTEINGSAHPLYFERSYLAEQEAVYYRFSIQEKWSKTETHRDSKGRTSIRTSSGWTTVHGGEWRPPFEVHDESGSIRVDPQNAEITAELIFQYTCSSGDPLYYGKGPPGSITHSTGTRQFIEWAILPGQQIYVIGSARVRDDAAAAEIAHDPDDPFFLISTRSEQSLRTRYAWISGLLLTLAVAIAAFLPALGQADLRSGSMLRTAQHTVLWAFLSGGGMLLIIAGLYLMLIYNGLVEVRNRARRAWSMIDVELRRRHDLIPSLVAIVRQMRDHESQVLEEVAQLRSLSLGAPSPQAAAAVTQTIDEQSRAFAQLFALVERYPSLKSDELFQNLTRELTVCENRIAMARSFYNESVNILNDRVQTLPDMLFVSLARAVKGTCIAASEFERKPIEVKFEA